MAASFERTRVFMTVMTYPHPSDKYTELVCTAGITTKGEWLRLYPVDYRYRPKNQQFHKYQWVEVDLYTSGANNDNRKESRRPKLDSIRVIGDPLSPKDDWSERRAIIDPLPHYTVNQLEKLHELEHTSLGIVRPKRVLDIEIRPADSAWKPKWQAVFQQFRLFEGAPKVLHKLPFSLHYVFECDDDDKPRKAMIEDWELGVLFLKESERLGSAEKAAERVKNKYLTEMCAPDRDVRFFMGTRFPYNTWLVLGVFWPPRTRQGRLF